MRTLRCTTLALFALTIAGCSSTPSTSLGSDETSLTVSVPEGGALDIRFEPQHLRTGEQVSVQLQGLRLESTASQNGHTVRLDAPGRTVQRVQGLTDGKLQATVVLNSPGSADGGLTARIPTSAHTSRVCNATSCTDVVEYDYDLHAPTGEGTTAWRTPDGRSVTIDRLRFELDAVRVAQAGRSTLTLAAPEPLVIVR